MTTSLSYIKFGFCLAVAPVRRPGAEGKQVEPEAVPEPILAKPGACLQKELPHDDKPPQVGPEQRSLWPTE